jgi:hypothetical protein
MRRADSFLVPALPGLPVNRYDQPGIDEGLKSLGSLVIPSTP